MSAHEHACDCARSIQHRQAVQVLTCRLKFVRMLRGDRPEWDACIAVETLRQLGYVRSDDFDQMQAERDKARAERDQHHHCLLEAEVEISHLRDQLERRAEDSATTW